MTRVLYLDTTKALGMFLVYYGHFIEKLYYAGSTQAFPVLKFIYSFHVPLFFFLAGIFWKPPAQTLPVILLTKIRTRLIPVVFFAVLSIPFFLILDHYSWPQIEAKARLYLYGQPMLNWLTWFLVCLFSLEIIIACLEKVYSTHSLQTAFMSAGLFFIVGFFAAEQAQVISDFSGLPINFWFLNEAFTAGGFYWLGYAFKTALFKPGHRVFDSLGLVLSGAFLLYSYGLNQGPFSNPHPIVLMNQLSHGNYPLFVATALSGIAMCLYATRLIPVQSRAVRFIGQNTLIYLGLNGLCLTFFDVKVIYKLAYIPQQVLAIHAYALVYVCLVLVLFIPVTWALKRVLPKWLMP